MTRIIRKSGYIATRPLKVGHGHVQAGELYPEEPTPALIHAGYVEKGDGPEPADPLVGVSDPAEADAIRAQLAGETEDEGDGLEDLTVAELRAKAEELALEVASGAKKADLVAAIRAQLAGDTEDEGDGKGDAGGE